MPFKKGAALLTLLFLSICFFSLYSNVGGQNGPIFITLDEAIETALVENNLVKAANLGYEKSGWDVKNAWTNLFPNLYLNTRYTWIDKQTFMERDFRQYLPPELSASIPQTVFQESYYSSLDVSMPIFNMNLYNGIRLAGKGESAAEANLKSVRRNITFQVVNTYLNVLKMNDLKNIRAEYLDLSSKNLQKAERLFEADRYSKNEVLRWKIDYQQQKSGLIESENGYRSSVSLLNRLMNKDVNASFNYEGTIPEKLKSETNRVISLSEKELADLISLSDDELVERNADLKALYNQNEISRITYENSYSGYMPNINFSYSYAWRENNTISFDDYSPKTVMVNFSLPIFTGFQNITKVKSTYKEYRQSSEQLEDNKKNVRLGLIELVHKITTLKAQNELAEINAEYSKCNYEIVENQKELGLVSNIEFIDAKLNYQNAKISKSSTYYDLISAVVELYYMLGKMEFILQ